MYYKTTAKEVIWISAWEKAVRNQLELVSNRILDNPKTNKDIVLEEYQVGVVKEAQENLEKLVKEFEEGVGGIICYVFRDGRPSNKIDEEGEVEDYLLIEYITEGDKPFIEIRNLRTRGEVEEVIIDLVDMSSEVKDIIVLSRGIIKDFEVVLDKHSLDIKVRWFE